MLPEQVKKIRIWIRQFPLLHKFAKFGFVGVASTLVSLFVFWIISLQFPQYNLLSKAIGYLMGFFVGFTLNKLWTYVEHTEEGERYLLKYMIVYGITFVVYLVLNFVCDHWLHPERYISVLVASSGFSKFAEWIIMRGTLVTNVLSIFVNVILNFLGTNFLVFKVPEPDKLFD
jgi:putative flippase GtrA